MTTTAKATEPSNARRPDPTGSSCTPTALERVSDALEIHPGATIAELARAAGTGHSTTGKALGALERTGRARRERGGRDQNNRATPDRWHATPHPDDETSANATSVDTPATKEEMSFPEHADTDSAPVDTIMQVDGQTLDSEPAAQVKQVPATKAATPGASGGSMADTGAKPPTSPSDTPSNPHAPASGNHAAEASAVKDRAAAPAPSAASGAARLVPGALRQMVVEHLTAYPEEAFTATAISRVIERSSGAIANALATLTRQGIARQVSDRPRRYQLATRPSNDLR